MSTGRIDSKERHYIGDGAYVDYDGFGFTLYAPRDEGDHWVYLEPQVVAALLRYIGQKWNADIVVREK